MTIAFMHVHLSSVLKFAFKHTIVLFKKITRDRSFQVHLSSHLCLLDLFVFCFLKQKLSHLPFSGEFAPFPFTIHNDLDCQPCHLLLPFCYFSPQMMIFAFRQFFYQSSFSCKLIFQKHSIFLPILFAETLNLLFLYCVQTHLIFSSYIVRRHTQSSFLYCVQTHSIFPLPILCADTLNIPSYIVCRHTQSSLFLYCA